MYPLSSGETALGNTEFLISSEANTPLSHSFRRRGFLETDDKATVGEGKKRPSKEFKSSKRPILKAAKVHAYFMGS